MIGNESCHLGSEAVNAPQHPPQRDQRGQSGSDTKARGDTLPHFPAGFEDIGEVGPPPTPRALVGVGVPRESNSLDPAYHGIQMHDVSPLIPGSGSTGM